MAIFHLDFKIVKRSEGMTSVAKAAYHARTRITDDRIGQVFDFSHRTDLHGHIILAPVSAPAHIVESSSALWNEVERVERQNNGQTARYFDVAIPVELNNDDKKKLVAEYCQKNFVDKGMIADIAFHDLDSNNPHAHVMLTLKTITTAGFGKKDRSWNDKKMVVQWRESWATMSNSYLEAIGSEERIDHRSLRTQCADALAQAEEAFSNEEKAFWIAKATETNRPAMQRVHRAKWNDTESQEQRATEQALRDYNIFSELPLEIVVDVKSFTISVLPEPQEIVLPDYPATKEPQPVMTIPAISRRPAAKSYRDPNKISKVGAAGKKSPVLVVPEPNKSTKLKTSSSRNTRAKNCAPMNNRKQVKPRQNGMFKRFTLLVVGYIRERFVWARRKLDNIDADHDKRIAENYVFDEVLGIRVPRSEFEKRVKFNNEQTSSKAGVYGNESDHDKTVRFPSRPNQEQPAANRNMDLTPSIPPEHMRQSSSPKLSPPSHKRH
ncbi:conjugal transfer protein [Salmonella enterica subsp. enterica serovar Muenchen]|uniref:MobQ family relaxase n=1 Tax=Salmonella enterica TaxID=28901 RepID=UPI00111C9547|nr:MobQ family relaxase [Salmonella enterica]EBW1317870.1 conjugal transfer protein [Salmonella enterica subsp. enterica serovar Muenchen]EDG8257380.1 conjugal transfer protein [Salmonella enterica subsp. enterica serovar Muenchen]EDH0624394.1 conjugal transfer protein [Salmonella enterica subsp. enterica serovar Muenchen]TRE12211.1 conjugal transfer protein [Salmonella enterica subsp. enterica serovar Muenchen]TSH64507.1 conjugal transfer protein [Salmonella enterica subsp. enterica serovar M